MTRLLLFGALLVVGCEEGGATDAGAGGGDGGIGPRVPHATLAWRVRCTDPTECRFEDPPARRVDHDDGQDGHEVLCDVTFDGTARRMDLTVRGPEGYGLEVRGAQIGREGGRLMGSLCQIRVFEPADVNLLTMCTSSNPMPGSACQIHRIDIREVDGEPTLLAALRCVDAPEEGGSAVRDVTPAEATTGSVEMSFTGCTGL